MFKSFEIRSVLPFQNKIRVSSELRMWLFVAVHHKDVSLDRSFLSSPVWAHGTGERLLSSVGSNMAIQVSFTHEEFTTEHTDMTTALFHFIKRHHSKLRIQGSFGVDINRMSAQGFLKFSKCSVVARRRLGQFSGWENVSRVVYLGGNQDDSR